MFYQERRHFCLFCSEKIKFYQFCLKNHGPMTNHFFSIKQEFSRKKNDKYSFVQI